MLPDVLGSDRLGGGQVFTEDPTAILLAEGSLNDSLIEFVILYRQWVESLGHCPDDRRYPSTWLMASAMARASSGGTALPTCR